VGYGLLSQAGCVEGGIAPLRAAVGAFKIIEGASLDKTFTTGLRPWEKQANRPCGRGKCTPIPALRDFPRRGKF